MKIFKQGAVKYIDPKRLEYYQQQGWLAAEVKTAQPEPAVESHDDPVTDSEQVVGDADI